MDTINAARAIASHVTPAEDSIDTALSANVRLMMALVESRQASGVARSVGQHAMAQIAEAQAALLEARQATLRAHKSLADTSRDLNIEPHAFGDVNDCPEPKGLARPDLRSVA